MQILSLVYGKSYLSHIVLDKTHLSDIFPDKTHDKHCEFFQKTS